MAKIQTEKDTQFKITSEKYMYQKWINAESEVREISIEKIKKRA